MGIAQLRVTLAHSVVGTGSIQAPTRMSLPDGQARSTLATASASLYTDDR